MRALIPVLLLAASTAAAYQPEYLPLHPGNQWIYQQRGIAGGEPITVVVDRIEVLDNKVWALVTGFPSGDAWLRLGDDGVLVARDPDTGIVSPWVAFSAEVGEPFPSEVSECTDFGTVLDTAAELRSPVGVFHNVFAVTYSSTCADAGIVADHYLPYIGLLRREETTIAGPRVWELTYARIGSVTFVSEPSVSFSLTLNRSVFVMRRGETPVLRARLTLRNHFLDTIQLLFASGQRFDLAIRNEAGETIYMWSADKLFPQVATLVGFPHGEKNYVVEVPLNRPEFPPGHYTVEGSLTTGQPREYSASAGFQIHPFEVVDLEETEF